MTFMCSKIVSQISDNIRFTNNTKKKSTLEFFNVVLWVNGQTT